MLVRLKLALQSTQRKTSCAPRPNRVAGSIPERAGRTDIDPQAGQVSLRKLEPIDGSGCRDEDPPSHSSGPSISEGLKGRCRSSSSPFIVQIAAFLLTGK